MKYLLFTTPTCSACPPVKQILKDLETKGLLKGESIDANSEKGMEKAVDFGIFSSPTVVFFDESGKEVARANNAHEVKSIVYDY